MQQPITTSPPSVPFLLVRPPSGAEEVLDDADTAEIPSSRSVPPHAPPARVTTAETELPSVIVDQVGFDASEGAEARRAISVDIPVDVTAPLDLRDSTLRSPQTRGSRGRGIAIALLAAAMAAGGTFAVVRVLHVSGQSLGAALHIVR